MSPVLHADLPRFVAFGEALTDLICTGLDSWISRCGGAPWNVARALSTLGELSAFGGAVSCDVFGQALWQESMDASLDPRFLQQVERSPLLAVVHETHPPRYFFIGDDSADLHFHPSGLPQGWRQFVRWAHFGGISLNREPLAGRLVELAESLKAQGVTISYDPNYRQGMDNRYDDTLERMSRLADVIKVSDEDLCGLFRSPTAHVGLGQLAVWNPQARLLYTRGAQGATLYKGAQEWSASALAVEVVDTVGAGDAAMAGFIYACLHELGEEAQLRYAMAAGAAACLQAGARSPSLAEVRALAAQVQLLP